MRQKRSTAQHHRTSLGRSVLCARPSTTRLQTILKTSSKEKRRSLKTITWKSWIEKRKAYENGPNSKPIDADKKQCEKQIQERTRWYELPIKWNMLLDILFKWFLKLTWWIIMSLKSCCSPSWCSPCADAPAPSTSSPSAVPLWLCKAWFTIN